MVKKISKICLFVLTECKNVTDTQTDRQTPHDDIGRACTASRSRNTNRLMLPSNKLQQAVLSTSWDRCIVFSAPVVWFESETGGRMDVMRHNSKVEANPMQGVMLGG